MIRSKINMKMFLDIEGCKIFPKFMLPSPTQDPPTHIFLKLKKFFRTSPTLFPYTKLLPLPISMLDSGINSSHVWKFFDLICINKISRRTHWKMFSVYILDRSVQKFLQSIFRRKVPEIFQGLYSGGKLFSAENILKVYILARSKMLFYRAQNIKVCYFVYWAENTMLCYEAKTLSTVQKI